MKCLHVRFYVHFYALLSNPVLVYIIIPLIWIVILYIILILGINGYKGKGIPKEMMLASALSSSSSSSSSSEIAASVSEMIDSTMVRRM